jgi:hypothetical protein
LQDCVGHASTRNGVEQPLQTVRNAAASYQELTSTSATLYARELVLRVAWEFCRGDNFIAFVTIDRCRERGYVVVMGAVAVITFNDVPLRNSTLKYERLGPLAIANRERYCARHGYTFISSVAVDRDRPACWAKIPAVLDALETHEWVLWADSDALIFDLDRSLEGFCAVPQDLIVQSHAAFFDLIGMPREQGLERMPINTGVFLVRATPWSREFLRQAYAQTAYVTAGEVWDGIGEQEAMTHLIRKNPEHRRHIGYVDGLQNHPSLYRPTDLFVHFYGNHAAHLIPPNECEEVISRWENACLRDEPFPSDRIRFHWCCIQNKTAAAVGAKGSPGHYLYRLDDVLAGAEP